MSKILLAEDDTDMRRFLVKALQNAGYEVISYDNGLSAYHRLCGGGAQLGFKGAAQRQGAVQAGPPARPGQRSAQDAGGLGPRVRAGRKPVLPRSGRADMRIAAGLIRARSSAEEHYLDMVG